MLPFRHFAQTVAAVGFLWTAILQISPAASAQDFYYSSDAAPPLHRSIGHLEAQRATLIAQLKSLGATIPAVPLSEAIAIFNSQAALRTNAADRQSPLPNTRLITEDEVIAVLTMEMINLQSRDLKREQADADRSQALRTIINTKQLPMDAKLNVVTKLKADDGTAFDVWNVNLVLTSPAEPKGFTIAIRKTYIRTQSPATASARKTPSR